MAGPSDPTSPRRARSKALLRTTPPLLLGLVVVAVAVDRAPLDWSTVWARARHTLLVPFAAAVCVHYVSIGVRTLRWRTLLRNAGERCAVALLAGALLASFFVNCVTPGRLGDLYRAYLVRRWEGGRASKVLGTVVVERALDLGVVLALLFVAVAIGVEHGAGRNVPVALASGTVVLAIAAGLLAVLRSGAGARLVDRLPTRLTGLYAGFREGCLGCLVGWPRLLGLTVCVWALDSMRFALVAIALGVNLGPAEVVLVTLVAALLSTVPVLPGGIGAVEGGVAILLASIAHVPAETAVTVALMDRSITYGSVIATGAGSALLLQARRPRATGAWSASARLSCTDR